MTDETNTNEASSEIEETKAYAPHPFDFSPVLPYNVSFSQIAASDRRLCALDNNGGVWIYRAAYTEKTVNDDGSITYGKDVEAHWKKLTNKREV